MVGWQLLESALDPSRFRGDTADVSEEIAWFLELDYCMRMSDVEAAFPMLPLHPDVWPFFLAPLAPQALETGDFGIVEPIL